MTQRLLPHHKLIAYGVAKELFVAVRGCHVRDAGLRDQALRAAKSACLNTAEGAGRVSRADKARVFAIARAEAGEAAAASPASARAMANTRALSARDTRPAPSAVLRQALLAARSA